MTAVRRGVAVALMLLVAGLFGAGPAGAHTDLVRATPGPGRTVPARTDRLVLEFTDAVLPRLAEVIVRHDRTENRVGEGPQVFDGTVVVGLRDLSPGAYDVEYRVVAVDGHPITGAYTFTVARTATRAKAATASAVTVPVRSGSPVVARRTPWTVPALGALGLLLIIGTRLARARQEDPS